jgi:preprotein translocase subunit SecA
MFSQLMEVIDNDYLRYILHVEAVQQQAAEPDLDRAVYAAAEDPVAETGALAPLLAAEQGLNVPTQTSVLTPPPGGVGAGGGNGSGEAGGAAGDGGAPRQRGQKAQIRQPNAPDPDALVPIVKQQHEKLGRNEPCWCGSGKKYKLCHGAA